MDSSVMTLIGGLCILIVVTLFLVIQQRSTLNAMKNKYEFFTKGKDINIDQTLINTMKELEETKKELSELKKKHALLREQVSGCLQNVKLKRYDAYEAMGGEMSYSILITDEKKNGVILTSIYGRDDSRCFAKEICEGKAKSALAEEEKSLL